MSEELISDEVASCTSCENYVDFAYFCLAKNDWKFPEDRPTNCDKFKKGNFRKRGLEDD